MDFKQKYLKYKKKYSLLTNNMKGGEVGFAKGRVKVSIATLNQWATDYDGNEKRIKHKYNYYIYQTIQSEKPIETVKEYIKGFNKYLLNIVEKSNFKKHIRTLKNQIINPSNNLSEKFEKFIPELLYEEYEFNRKELLLKSLEKVTKEDLTNFIIKYINKENRMHIIVNHQ
jgi:secreted Zn-dependent insulinase-like peptidase